MLGGKYLKPHTVGCINHDFHSKIMDRNAVSRGLRRWALPLVFLEQPGDAGVVVNRQSFSISLDMQLLINNIRNAAGSTVRNTGVTVNNTVTSYRQVTAGERQVFFDKSQIPQRSGGISYVNNSTSLFRNLPAGIFLHALRNLQAFEKSKNHTSRLYNSIALFNRFDAPGGSYMTAMREPVGGREGFPGQSLTRVFHNARLDLRTFENNGQTLNSLYVQSGPAHLYKSFMQLVLQQQNSRLIQTMTYGLYKNLTQLTIKQLNRTFVQPVAYDTYTTLTQLMSQQLNTVPVQPTVYGMFASLTQLMTQQLNHSSTQQAIARSYTSLLQAAVNRVYTESRRDTVSRIHKTMETRQLETRYIEPHLIETGVPEAMNIHRQQPSYAYWAGPSLELLTPPKPGGAAAVEMAKTYKPEPEVVKVKAPATQAQNVDIRHITDQVFREIERKLRVERERRGIR